MNRTELEKKYKQKYHVAFEDAKNPQNTADEPRYSYHQLIALMEMAKYGVYPDGHFSDEECNVWGLFTAMEAIGKAKERGEEVI